MRRTVIGIGNLLRADDGIGVHVVERLRRERPDIESVDLSTANLEILDYVRNRDVVVIVDAMRSGAEPGTVRRLGLGELGGAGFRDSHGLDLGGLIRLGWALYPGEMPGRLVVIGVEAGDVESFGCGLTEEVEAALPGVVDAVVEELG